MSDLIIADVIRIVRKPTYRIMLVLTLIGSLVIAIRTKMDLWNGLTFVTDQTTVLGLWLELVFGVLIFLSVYADEFTSNSMQCLIGHGVSRFKLLLAKFIDCVLVTLITFGAYAVFIGLVILVMRPGLTGMEAAFLYGRILVGMVATIGFATISMIFLYFTKNTAIATLVDVLLIVYADNMVNFLTKIPVIKFMHLENMAFANAVYCANVSWMLGNASGFTSMLWQLIKICAISLVLSYLLFRKKELDF